MVGKRALQLSLEIQSQNEKAMPFKRAVREAGGEQRKCFLRMTIIKLENLLGFR